MPKNVLVPQQFAGLVPPVAEQSIRFDAVRGTDLRGYFPSAIASSDRWMVSFWIKPQDVNVGHTYLHAEIDANNVTSIWKNNFNKIEFEAKIAGVVEANFRSSRLWPLDTSNWHHIYIQFFRTAGNLQMFVNGNIWNNFDFFTTPTNIGGYAFLNPAAEHFVGTDLAATRRFSGMMADLHCISGDTAGNPNGFGFFDANGTWMQSDFVGPWNVDGFKLNFGRTLDLGEDFSGGGNDFPVHTNGAGAGADQFNDWPERNYCILDRLDPRSFGSITEGGTVLGVSNGVVTMRPPANSGVYYYERNGVGVTWDTGVSGEFDPILTPATYNFGQLPFVGVGPGGGELTVVSLNLPTPLITNARDYFHAIGYTGNSTNPRTIINGSRGIPQHRNLTHRTDHLWVKNMSPSLGNGHFLMDRLRPGVQLPIDTTAPEEATNLNGFIVSIADPGPGFDVDVGGTDDENVNAGVSFYSAVSWHVEEYAQNIRVLTGVDDAEEVVDPASGDVTTSSSDLEIVLSSGLPQQEVGLRFNDVRIPQGATILDARVQFETDELDSGANDVLIFCEDIDNAPVMVAGAGNFNITARTKTSPGVAWAPPDWTILQERAAGQRTTDFASEVQQVVDRIGWAPGNSLLVILAGDPGGTLGQRTAEAFDGVPNASPELLVKWRLATPLPGVSLFSYDGMGKARDLMHGLGAAPDFIAIKRRDVAADWSVYMGSIVSAGNPEDGRLSFNNNNAFLAGNDWDNTVPGGTFFRVGTSARVNAAGGKYAGMAVANLEGFSKVFRYVGNNQSNGPVVYCGFKPRFILIKSTAAGGQWVFHTRASGASGAIQSVNNQMDGNMYLNTDDQATQLDSLWGFSRGFEIRDTNININTNLQEYVGIAFAEVPFQNAKGAL